MPAEIVRPALTTAAKGSVASEKMPMPIKMNKRKRKRMREDPSNADTTFLVDNPSSSLHVTLQCAHFAGACLYCSGCYLMLDQKLLSSATISGSLGCRNVMPAAESPALRSRVAPASSAFVSSLAAEMPDLSS